MPSLLETVTSLLRQAENLEKLAAVLDIDTDRAATLVELATPVVITGLADRAFEQGGSDIVVRLLDGVDPTIVDNPLVFVERGEATIGEGLLLSIFAGEHAAITTALAERGDVPPPVIARLLPGILALAIGVLGRRRAVRGVDDAGILTLLAAEKSVLPAEQSHGTGVGEDAAGLNQIPAMAGTAASVDGVGVSGGPKEPVRAPAGGVEPATGSDGGTTSSATDFHETEGEPPASGDRTGPTNRSTPREESPPVPTAPDGLHPLVLIFGGLTAVILLAWALSQLAGGGSAATEAEGGGSIDVVEQPVTSAADGAAVDPDGATPEAELGRIDADDNNGDTGAEQSIDDTAEAGDGATDPITINEELSLDPITFEVRSATITDEGLAVLDMAADYLKADPELTIEIAGHTDSDGDAADNLRLSQDRADAVKAYLESLGIDGARMTPIGYGENDPVASNDNDAGKAQNRRIEFVIQ